MQIASPIFLLALLPWVALVLWLLLGKRRRANVPFLELWKGPVTGPTARRRIGMPPLALAAALAAMLLMILAAARPGIRTATSANQIPLVIVIDRGITMSAGKPPPFAALAEELKPAIRDQFGQGPVHIVLLPGGEVIERNGTEWVNAVKSVAPTAIDTSGILLVALRQQLEINPDSPVIVLTDQELHISDERLVQMVPQTALRNTSIAHVAARISPAGQVMVRVRNQSDEKRAVIRVLGDEMENSRQEIELPATGQVRDYFLPFDPKSKVIRVETDADDDFAADNAAFLVRRGSWPIIEPRTPLFAELQRLIEKYSKLRPATDQSKPVAIVSAQDAGAGSQIILAKVESAAMGEATLVDHPITRSLEKMDWKKLAPAGIAEPAGDGWKPLVRVGGKTAIAIRETPARQVWIGLQTQPIANTPEFVILWSNIFDWVGEGGEEFVARRTGDLGNAWTSTQEQPAGLKPGWWPGVYRRSDGALLAVNAPDVIVSKSLASDWKPKLAELGRQHRQKTGVKNLTTPLILAAMGLMLLSALTWRGGLKKLREPQQSRHAQDARVTV